MDSLYGLRVHERNDFLTCKPKIKVSDSFQWITPEVRQGMNDWLFDMFGGECSIYTLNQTEIFLCKHSLKKVKDATKQAR